MIARVGFVVIGRNEGVRLEACLAAVTATGAPLVYADSASSDGSPDRAARAGATVIELDPARRMNAARGRREGAERLFADHPGIEYVQFLDGDCVLQPGWIEAATAFLAAQPDVAAVCGRRFEAHPEASIYNRLCNAEWDTPVGEAEAVGGDSLMRAEAYRAVGGYDPAVMAGEEPELCLRLRQAGWRIWRLDAPMTEHDVAMFRLSQWWARSRRAGIGYAQTWRMSGGALFGRQLRGAMLWTVAVPLAGIGVALAAGRPWLLGLIPAAYAAQLVRLAARRGTGEPGAWRRAGLMLVTKLGEGVGAVSAFVRPGNARSVEYKEGGSTGIDLSFGMREAIVTSLLAIAVACYAAWRSLNG